MSQKSLNDEERGGNCLLVPERSYGSVSLATTHVLLTIMQLHQLTRKANSNERKKERSEVICVNYNYNGEKYNTSSFIP